MTQDHRPRRFYIFNKKKYDYLSASIIEGFNELGIAYSALYKSNYSRGNRFDLNWRRISKHDVLLDFSGSERVRSYLKRLRHPNVFRVDGGDDVVLKIPDRDLYRGVFKRELSTFVGDRSDHCIWSLPFAAERRYFPDQTVEKDIDLSCMLETQKRPLRKTVEDYLLSRCQPNWFVGRTNERAYARDKGSFVATPRYQDIVWRSRACVNVMGLGYDCARFWEILAAGAVLISQRPAIQFPHPFEHKVNALFFETVQELGAILDELETGALSWQEIARAGQSHVQAFHTSQKRAERMLAQIEIALAENRRLPWSDIGETAWGRMLLGETWDATPGAATPLASS